jgi:hypothetical protein
LFNPYDQETAIKQPVLFTETFISRPISVVHFCIPEFSELAAWRLQILLSYRSEFPSSLAIFPINRRGQFFLISFWEAPMRDL